MAVSEVAYGRTAYVVVNTGTSASGNPITANVSLGTLNQDEWDAQKAFNIAEALEGCLAETMNAVRSTGTVDIQPA